MTSSDFRHLCIMFEQDKRGTMFPDSSCDPTFQGHMCTLFAQEINETFPGREACLMKCRELQDMFFHRGVAESCYRTLLEARGLCTQYCVRNYKE